MSCPTCDHTMKPVVYGEVFWCQRCGTIKEGEYTESPKLVGYAVNLCKKADHFCSDDGYAANLLDQAVITVREACQLRETR